MEDHVAVKRLALVLSTALAALVVWLTPLFTYAPSPYLTVQFFDVGQGDATLITTPGGVQVLIDGGADAGVLRALGRHMPWRDRTLDVVVATHPDRDHIGGLIDVLARYQVASVVLTDKEGESDTAVAYATAVEGEGATVVTAQRGQAINLGASTTLEILYPEGSVAESETNAASIIMQLRYGNTTFMLTGDAPKHIEEYLVLTHGANLKSDVLKVGHHGSRTSTSELFLAEVDPDFAIISAGANNRYGHPHVEVTDALFNAGVTTFTTAEHGTVTFFSDGSRVWTE